MKFIEELEKKKGHKILVVEDGAPGHNNKLAREAQKRLSINTLDHQPTSPDLNPIEPLWLILKN